MTTKSWRAVLEEDGVPLTHDEAFGKLVAVCADAPQHAEAIRDVMWLLARYQGTSSALRGLANSAAHALVDHPDAMTLQHNVRVYSAQLDAINPPEPDFPD